MSIRKNELPKRCVVLEGYSRYFIWDDGTVTYRDTGKLCPDYDDGKNGYRKIKLYPDGSKKRKSFWVSRLIYQAFIGPIPPKMEIDHKDGNRLNNTLENLILVTHKQNQELKKQRDSRYLFNRKAPKRNRKKRGGGQL
jgi:hypothetical protein